MCRCCLSFLKPLKRCTSGAHVHGQGMARTCVEFSIRLFLRLPFPTTSATIHLSIKSFKVAFHVTKHCEAKCMLPDSRLAVCRPPAPTQHATGAHLKDFSLPLLSQPHFQDTGKCQLNVLTGHQFSKGLNVPYTFRL